MADVYIPGVRSRFETDKMIEDLMKLERIPKERAEKTVSNLETQKTTWQDVGVRVSALRDSSRVLFSFQNPFNERVALSTDESVLQATATREASEQTVDIRVTETAKADRFLSKPLETNFKVPAGDYQFNVGSEEIKIQFKGGSLKEFVDAINRRNKNVIRASLINVQQGSTSLILESLVTGTDNRLGFQGPAEEFAVQIGMAERVSGSDRQLSTSSASLQVLTDSQALSKVSEQNGALVFPSRAAATIPITPPVRNEGPLILEYELRSRQQADSATTPLTAPQGPTLKPVGEAVFGGVSVTNDTSTVPLPPWAPPPQPVRVDTLSVLSLQFSDGSNVQLPPIQDSASFEKQTIDLSAIAAGKTLVGLQILNGNTHRDIEIQKIRIQDPEASGNLKPLNPISVASDATINFNGIQIQRPTNKIDDLIPGVSLNLLSESDSNISLSIEPNREAVKESIIALVGNYNRLLAEINVLTRNDDKIIRELGYLDKTEQDELKEKLGSLQGDSSLNQLKSSLQGASIRAWPNTNQDLTMLAQLGISTDASRSGASSGYDASRLRGYLEIDEKKLDAALRDNFIAVKELFGSDTDSDRVIDTGFAWTADRIARSWVETGGILQLKTSSLDNRIQSEERRIETLDRQLAAKEDDLRRKYGAMEGALNTMERTSNSLDQFSTQNQQR